MKSKIQTSSYLVPTYSLEKYLLCGCILPKTEGKSFNEIIELMKASKWTSMNYLQMWNNSQISLFFYSVIAERNVHEKVMQKFHYYYFYSSRFETCFVLLLVIKKTCNIFWTKKRILFSNVSSLRVCMNTRKNNNKKNHQCDAGNILELKEPKHGKLSVKTRGRLWKTVSFLGYPRIVP